MILDAVPFGILLLTAFLWLATVIAASIAFRRKRGKAIIPRRPVSALFSESRASGRKLGSLRGLGGARNCLMVSVDEAALSVTPIFPFTLMFLPEIWGLEHVIPRRDVLAVERTTGLVGGETLVTYRRGEARGRLALRLRDPDGFERALLRQY